MDSTERRLEIPHHVAERGGERRTPSDQHIVMTAAQPAAVNIVRARGRQSHDFAQPTPHPIALHGIADLPRHRKADADRIVLIAPARLQHERTGRDAQAGCRRPKIAAPLQPLHGIRETGAAIRH